MNKRQELLFTILVAEYIKEAIPVSSQGLLEKSQLEVSSATIRNELAQLEDLGLITQPHTSAGRIPTEKGYVYYIRHHLESKKLALPAKYHKSFVAMLESGDEAALKNIAKIIASLTNHLVFMTFGESHNYYTGLSQLFNQPEFQQHHLVHDISKVIDHFDEVIYKIYPMVSDDISILVGSQNPFSSACSVLMTQYSFQKHSGLLGVLGPMRMDYATNKELLLYIKDSLKI